MIIRPTDDADVPAIVSIHESAFGQNEEALLTIALLSDPSAAPRLSLMAMVDGWPVGHILFTNVTITGAQAPISATILAPLAVMADAQGRGIGGELVRTGLHQLADGGTDLVFVLGHPGYYPRFGFQPAGAQNLHAPFPIAPQNADAWMVQELRTGVIGHVRGQVMCADTLNKAEYWCE